MPGKRRSEGCRTCVRRRIKCDRTRPHCQRCQKSNLVCDIPPSPQPQFQDETSFVVARHSRLQASSPWHSDTRLLNQPSVNNEDTFCAFFLASYFTTAATPENDFHANKSWILTSFNSPSQNPISNLALRCLITGYFGSAHGSSTLQNDARKLYTNTLHQLRLSMTDPVKSRGFDVPAAASLLTIYEYTATTSQTGWLEHLRGIATLFELKGPSFFHKHPARALFIFIRMSIVFATVIWRERSYLERSEWQDFLIAAEDEEETLQGIRIVNLLARVSGLIQGMLQPHNNPQSDWSSILDDLADWHQTWSRCLPACLPRSVPAGSSTEHTVLRKILWYTRLNVAAAFCQYHAAIILVHKWSHRSATQDSAMEPHPATVQEHALSICQSIPYLLAEEHSHLGAFYLLFPAYVACQALNPEQAERQWLAGILAQVARDKGIAIAKNLVHKLEEGQMGGKE